MNMWSTLFFTLQNSMNMWSTLFFYYIFPAQAWMQVDVGAAAATKDVGVPPQPRGRGRRAETVKDTGAVLRP